MSAVDGRKADDVLAGIDPALVAALNSLTDDLGYASILDVMMAREALASGRIDDGEIGTYALDDEATS